MSDNKGIIVRDDKGKFIKGTRPHNLINSSATARTMAEKRWAKYRRAAADWVVDEMRGIDPNVKGGADAWGLLVSRQAVALMDSDKPRGDDLLAIGRAIGAMPNDADKMQAIQTQTQRQTQPDIVLALLALVGGTQSDDIIDISTNDAMDGTATDAGA